MTLYQCCPGAFEEKNVSIQYFDVIMEPGRLPDMLKYSEGNRKVPVIVENGKVTIGYHGKG